jgi:DNA-binding NarL/FixJ family response regulator
MNHSPVSSITLQQRSIQSEITPFRIESVGGRVNRGLSRPKRPAEEGRIRVAIADDDDRILDEITKLLKLRFDVVGRFGNGRELVQAVGKLLPSVVTTDITMPEMNGIEACRLITSKHADVKVIVISIHNDPIITRASFEAGACAYVWKPLIYTELIPAIENVLAGRMYRSSKLQR